MKPSPILVAVLLTLSARAEAGGGGCPETELDKRLAEIAATKQETAVAAYDHKHGVWTFRYCSKEGVCAAPAGGNGRFFSLELNNVPLLKLGGKTEHAIVVYDTNTLLYETSGLKGEDTEREDVAELREFASTLGEALRLVAAVSGPPPYLVGAPAAGIGIMAFEGGKTCEEMARIQCEAQKEKARPEDLLAESLSRARADDGAEVVALVGAVKALQGQQGELERRSEAAFQHLQAVELGHDPGPPPSGSNLESLHQAFDALVTARDGFRLASARACGPILADLDEALLLHLAKTTTEELPRKRARYDQLMLELRLGHGAAGRAGCTDDQAAWVRQIAGEIASRPPSLQGQPEPVAARWLPLRTEIARHTAWVAAAQDLRAAGQKLLGAREALVKQAAEVDIVAQRASGRDACAQTAGAMRLLEPEVELKWDKRREMTFKLASAGPRNASVVKTHPDKLELKFRLERRTWTYAVGFGLLGVFGEDTKNPTWQAIADPTDPAGKRKIIARTANASRSGAPTAILTLHPPGWEENPLAAGIDLGVGLDPDRLFVSLGASFQIAPIARVGFGYGLHRVKRLTEPQRELAYENGSVVPGSLTVVSSSDDISTRDTLQKAVHVSLVITLGNLNPFKPKE